MRHYACAILKRDGKILLGKRAAHRKAYPCCWDVIGGRVEEGETLEEALHRELGEEIGVVPVSHEVLSSVVDNGPQERGEATYHMYLVRSWTGGDPAMMDNEHTELAWFSIEDACALPDLALAEYVDVFRLTA
ncbi:MAG: NUDIX domain-containing protein [Janthinobacterium lividum]